MIVLGINGGVRLGYQDISAALVINGKLVAAVEEERLNRIKHSAGQLPQKAIQYVLAAAGVNIKDVDYVASHGETWGDSYQKILEGYFKFNFGFCPPVVRIHHHDAHAASAYFASGFENAMILTLDSSGDGISTQLSTGKGNQIKVIERLPRPVSLGMFYSLISQYCGFTRDRDEYKLMGLSSYGNRHKYDLSWLLPVKDGCFALNTAYIKEILPGEPQPTRQEMMFSEKLLSKLGPCRRPEQALTQHYKDIAAAAQQQLETAIIELVTNFHNKTGLRKICLAGGVALNCVANQQIMNLPFIDEIYVQPASGDAGISLGAAYLVSAQNGQSIKPMGMPYSGPEFTNNEIENALKICGLPLNKTDNPAIWAAKQVAGNKVIGWFQGKMEFGPRALGARSILANPTQKRMQEIVNRKIKFRESFRPFCPSIMESESGSYFKGKQKSAPCMTITYEALPFAVENIPAVVHVDKTARIQTLNEIQNPLYYAFLKELQKENGHPVSLNTSFNRNNEPIVHSPIDAISTFYGSGMDALVMGNYILEKKA